MSEQSAAAGSDQSQARPPRRGVKALAVALAGGLLTAGVVIWATNSGPNLAPNTSDLAIVAVSDIAAATPTLNPSNSAELAAEAKDCKVPLARVMISKAPGSSGGTIRIRSGNYLSPPFQLTDTPQQVATPFPAPYPTGRGVISIEGNANGAVVSLYPAWTVGTVSGTAARNVVWKPNKPCG